MLWPILVFACFPAEATEWFKSWISISLAALSPLPADEYLWLLKNISWLTFPLWPLALWGIYAWRDQIRQAPLIIPLSFSVVLKNVSCTLSLETSHVKYVILLF